MASNFQYIGSELELFAAAHNWKAYWAKSIIPLIRGDVVEVGAGMGTNTPFLDVTARGRWLRLEPDSRLLAEMVRSQDSSKRYENVLGTIAALPETERFDTLIYIDVLEHIDQHEAELVAAANKLRPGGRVIVLSPAHQSLYTPFDEAIGHHRRYSRKSLRDAVPRELSIERLFYLDSVGLVASAANRLFLRQSMPTRKQIQLWDGWMVPVSRMLDPLLFHSVGKTVVGVLRKAP